jgi:DNA-directed RNA polymerase subunit RPC12/RpoP
MVFWDQEGGAEFPFDKEDVFETLVEVIKNIDEMKVDKVDILNGKIIAKNGITLTYRGEDIPIYVKEVSPGITRVSVTSTPKNGVLMGGTFDLDKNRKNIEKIFDETSKILDQKNLKDSKSHKPDQPALATVKCPYCGRYNIKEAKFCAKCGRGINNNIKSELKSCPYCGKYNKKEAIYCVKCGRQLKIKKDSKKCSNCGFENLEVAEFCIECGKKFISTENNYFCPKCNTQINSETKFCPECGNKIEQINNNKICPKCNSTIDKDVKFCPECGENLKISNQ